MITKWLPRKSMDERPMPLRSKISLSSEYESDGPICGSRRATPFGGLRIKAVRNLAEMAASEDEASLKYGSGDEHDGFEGLTSRRGGRRRNLGRWRDGNLWWLGWPGGVFGWCFGSGHFFGRARKGRGVFVCEFGCVLVLWGPGEEPGRFWGRFASIDS